VRVAATVAAEFPALRLWTASLERGVGRSTPELKARLRDLSDGFRGPQAVALRTQPIPHAYRVFARQIGLDPDRDGDRVPIEHLAVERLKAGGFRSHSLLYDALTIAILETSVGIWALDAGKLSGELSVREAVEHEPLGRLDERAPWLPAGRLVVADDLGPVAVLLGDVARGHGVTPATSGTTLFAIQVEGVPSVHVEEALWIVADIVDGTPG
jgi:DNA/RNA-binding domain of Phe-tRNA-synthetase-like protein